jgi:hypothetical protein
LISFGGVGGYDESRVSGRRCPCKLMYYGLLRFKHLGVDGAAAIMTVADFADKVK